jgi:hypothetical protein
MIMHKTTRGCLVTAAIALTCGLMMVCPARAAEDIESIKRENAALRQQVDKLTGEVDQIKSLLAEKGVPVPAAPTSKPVTSALDIQLYGYIKLDASHDDSQVSAGNFARWVESEAILKNDGHFNMTANQTRLGMLIKGPSVNDLSTSGQVEIDFYGAGGTENKPEPQLRLAFAKADWKDANFSLLAGQATDIISPLNASTINYSVAWWQGNIGYRRPQIRLTKGLKFSDQVELKLEVSASRTISDKLTSTDPDPGADAEWPTGMGRVSMTFPVGGNRPATVGFSGHYGVEERHESATSPDVDVNSWSLNADLKLPITKWLMLQAEGFIGENLSTYLGGIGQGYNAVQADTIESIGGWAAATLTPCKDWTINLGAGVDNPTDEDLAADMRASNVVYFGNVTYALTSNLQLAFELSYLRTTYVGTAPGTDLREQFAVIYKF